MKGGDKMDSKTLWTVVVTALVVALLTSLITVKLTGNVATVYDDKDRAVQVYTKSEVDSLIKNIFVKPQNITLDTLRGGPVGSLQSTLLLNAGNIEFKQNYTQFNKLFKTHISPGGFEQKADWERSGTVKKINFIEGEISTSVILARNSDGNVPSPGSAFSFFTFENSTLITPDGIFFSVYNNKDPLQNYRYKCAPDIAGVFKCKKL